LQVSVAALCARCAPKKSEIRNQKGDKRMGRTILIALVVAIVVGGAAGFGGYKMGDSAGFERANQVRQQFTQQRQAAGGQGQQGGLGTGGGGQGRGAGITGVIKSVNGDTLTVTIGQRDVQVSLSDKTQIERTASGARADLTAGTRVLVTPDSGGTNGGTGNSFNAVSVLILPAQ
jgi:hypothetical protein